MSQSKMSEIVANKLIKMILSSDEYLPGNKMPSQRELCDIYGVSRQVIREALKKLESQGFIVTMQGSGSYVAENPGIQKDPLGIEKLGIDDEIEFLKYWYNARRSIECEVVKLAVLNATDEELNKIKQKQDYFEQTRFESDKDALFADRDFHLSIAKASHNIILERCTIFLLQSFYYNLLKSTTYVISSTLLDVADNHHRRIIKFLFERDLEGAYMAMRAHMNHALRILTLDTKENNEIYEYENDI